MKKRRKGTRIDTDTEVNTPLAMSALVFCAVVSVLLVQKFMLETIPNPAALEFRNLATSSAQKHDKVEKNNRSLMVAKHPGITVRPSQKLSHGKVVIDRVVFEAGRKGFVVLHEPKNVGISVCKPLAASALLEGEQNNVSISVGGGFRNGRLNVMLHYDNGDGIFDPKTDPTAEFGGAKLSRNFTVSR